MAETIRNVVVGDVYAGITGNRMEVIEVDGERCLLRYIGPDPEEFWEDSDGVARYLDLVREGPTTASTKIEGSGPSREAGSQSGGCDGPDPSPCAFGCNAWECPHEPPQSASRSSDA